MPLDDRPCPGDRGPRARILPAGLLALFLSGEGRAADLQTLRGPLPPPPAPAEWIVTVTGNAEVGPAYPGSDRYTVYPYPSISYRRVGEPIRFSAPDDGLSVSLLDTPWLRAGPVVRFLGGRYLASDPQLVGLRKVDFTVEPGLFAEFYPVSAVRIRGELRHGVNGHDGFVGNVGIDYILPYGRFTFSAGPRLALGDTRFFDTFFSLTPAEAALNPLVTPFRARGGVSSVGALGAISYDWSDRWRTTLYGGYNRLVGDAAASPITRNIGSPDQFIAGAQVSYSFTMPALF